MRRIALFVGLLSLGFLIGSALPAQTPGTLMVKGATLATNGCLANLNATKQKQCTFSIVAPGVKLTDLACTSVVSMVVDTVINCTFSPVTAAMVIPANTKTAAAGMFIIPESWFTLANGCSPQLNHPLLNCGFNVVLSGVAIPNLTLTSSVSGNYTTLVGTYPPVPPPVVQTLATAKAR